MSTTQKAKTNSLKGAEGVAVVVGTIIGAGIFGIPFAVAQIGIIPALLLLVGVAVGLLLVHLLLGEVVLRSEIRHRIVGYAEHYLGIWGKILISFSSLFAGFGGLLAYGILGGVFLNSLLGSVYGGSEVLYGVIFFILAAIGVARGARLIGWEELIMSGLLVVAIIVIVLFTLPSIDAAANWYLFKAFNLKTLIIAYGIILFSMGGTASIPEVQEVLEGSRREGGRIRAVKGSQFKKVIIWGTFLPAALYLVFALSVVGITGEATSKDAIDGLVPFLGKGVVMLGAAFGLLAVFTSFLVIGDNLRKIFRYDYKIKGWLAAGLVIGIPFLAYLVGLRDFITVIGIVGAVMGGIEGVAILLMYKRARTMARRQPEYKIKVPDFVLALLAIIFIFGMLYAAASIFI